MATSAVATTLGSRALRSLVQEASMNTQKKSLDLGGIVWMEHINLVVGDMSTATKFYVDLLGFTPERDAKPKSNHFNLGQQQLHVAVAESDGDLPQRVTGSIGLTVPSLQRIRERLGNAKLELIGTLFSIEGGDDSNVLTVSCPWGNIIHLYDISVDDKHQSIHSASQSSQKMAVFHSDSGVYGPHRMAVRGNPGIRYVEIACHVGTVASIAEFYEELLGCHVTRTSEPGVATVCVGPGVHLAFVENENLTKCSLKSMNGVHLCIYIPNFQRTYDVLKKRDLIWTNPRFTHLDSCETWEECLSTRTFRFRDIIDVQKGEKIFELEHETRPMLHGQYMKVPPYISN
jgi:catechol-2,3-dioxygenase